MRKLCCNGGDTMIDNKDLIIQYSIFSRNIKSYRKQNQLTQEMLAEKADLSISYIKQIESGTEFKNVSLTAMLKLSKALGITVRDLFKS